MDKLKEFIRGNIDYVDPGIIQDLKKYKTIKIDSIVYDTKEIIDKISKPAEGTMTCCLLGPARHGMLPHRGGRPSVRVFHRAGG